MEKKFPLLYILIDLSDFWSSFVVIYHFASNYLSWGLRISSRFHVLRPREIILMIYNPSLDW